MRHKNETEHISTYGLVFEGVDAALRFADALLALGVGVMASNSSSSLETLIAVVVALRFADALLALGAGIMASNSSSSLLETLIAVVVNFFPSF